jgi:hypothetical protein
MRGDVQHLLDAAAHLLGRLVGKRDSQYRPGRKIFSPDEPRDAVHQHARLAAAGTGEHQHVRVLGSNGLALGIVQGRENIGYIHGAILTSARLETHFFARRILFLRRARARLQRRICRTGLLSSRPIIATHRCA